MSTYYNSRKTKVITAKNFRDSFSLDNTKKVGYVFLGKASAFPNENVASEIEDTLASEKQAWDTMIAAKRVLAGDVEFVIPKYQWTANTKYKQFDDTKTLDFLLSTSDNGGSPVYPMYVINSEGNVYKCLCNNVSANSTVEPTGDYGQNQGFIQTVDNVDGSGYLWKYLYNVRDSNKFLTTDWIPVPFNIDEKVSDYNLSANNLIDGSLNKVILTNKGSGYVHTTFNVASFSANATSLTVTDDFSLATSNIKKDMLVTGTGIFQGTYISSIDTTFNRLILSTPTVSPGGGTSNSVTALTRISIVGDGTQTTANVRLNGNNEIQKIEVINFGSNYTRANVFIYGSGTGANARAVLPPKYGHGYNPAMELGSTNVMITSRIGDVDASEGGLIPTDTPFRQYGVLVNPHKYGANVTTELLNTEANSVISQTTNLNLVSGSGSAFQQFEMLYQGSLANPTFKGYVVSQGSNVVKLSEVSGNVTLGSIITGANSSIYRIVSAIKNPEFQPYAGDILYAQNILKVERSEGQAEEIKLIFKF